MNRVPWIAPRYLRSTAAAAIALSSNLGVAAAVEPITLTVRVESRVADVSQAEVASFVEATLTDPRGWSRAGMSFVISPSASYLVVLAEPSEADRLCRPLQTQSQYSCQNGPTVVLNADRWRQAFAGWDAELVDYRRYMVNHEVGHLFGQRHPVPRCPTPGGRAAVMEQQSKGLEGCRGNAWPLDWEIELASRRPLKMAPDPSWQPANPKNLGDNGTEAATVEASAATDAVAPLTPTTSTFLEAAVAISTASSEPSLSTSIDAIATPAKGPHRRWWIQPVASSLGALLALVVLVRLIRVLRQRREDAMIREIAASVRDPKV